VVPDLHTSPWQHPRAQLAEPHGAGAHPPSTQTWPGGQRPVGFEALHRAPPVQAPSSQRWSEAQHAAAQGLEQWPTHCSSLPSQPGMQMGRGRQTPSTQLWLGLQGGVQNREAWARHTPSTQLSRE
jgi:hypothetical protein